MEETTHVRIAVELKDRLKAVAEALDMTMIEAADKAITDFIELMEQVHDL